ncbi:2'-deoxycytidine 5'-triphosphate deaminase [Alkalicaulis satelles]|uniref:2'-deoxycytidine 5'-triphosphate deaminase n=1 Tax=Alkalicaulis satelles TaxID=2609175 RepID=A0A5M6ZJS1_9PROT|nr:2'-deoxycytidine 5'-triphosphate deaminase [Alkalicaulis satelles]KAA5804590.1 2'-deoxycytidine 5'-triphosphate deaminase [Alkalicaulis satelles]
MSAKPSGVLPDQALEAAFEAGWIRAGRALEPGQIQPASLDLRLGRKVWRLRASFLPGPGRTVADRLGDNIVMHALDLDDGAVLETGCVYLAELEESLELPADLTAAANPKSSTGRLDVFTRVIGDGSTAFDQLPAGYKGPLYVEISPRTFSVLARPGDRLTQLRLRRGEHAPLRSITLSVDVLNGGGPAGWRARRHSPLVDLSGVGAHEAARFWEPLYAEDGRIVLDPGEFYILASREAVSVPVDEAAEMAPVALEIGEFRAHYAGFFDPGFGVAEAGGAGSRAVLEVRGRDVPFILDHGQAVARLVYEPMAGGVRQPYGAAGSNYQAQGLKLSKHFKS